MSEKKEILLTVPAELTRHCKGCALDFGSSTLKVVYRSKADEEEVASGETKFGHLRIVLFPKSELSEALEYIKQHAQVTRTGDDLPNIYTTGVGCTLNGKLVCEKLNIKLENLTEFDCFAKSFVYLASRMPRTEFLENFLDDATKEPVDAALLQLKMIAQIHDTCKTAAVPNVDEQAFMQNIQSVIGRPSSDALEAAASGKPLREAEPDMFPCILAMIGSGNGYFQIEKDGSFKCVDYSNRSGKAFCGMGSLLTGCKTFEELIELASRGNARSLDLYSDELVDASNAVEGEDSMYTMSAKESTKAPTLVFCLGKAVGTKLEDFKREDLARAWLNYILLDIVQTSANACTSAGISRLFFCGGFCSDPLVRSIVTTEFARRSLMLMAFGQAKRVQFDFVKPGAHLGALGCVVTDVEQFLNK